MAVEAVDDGVGVEAEVAADARERLAHEEAGIDVDGPHHARIRDLPAFRGDRTSELRGIAHDEVRPPVRAASQEVARERRPQPRGEADELAHDHRRVSQTLLAGQPQE